MGSESATDQQSGGGIKRKLLMFLGILGVFLAVRRFLGSDDESSATADTAEATPDDSAAEVDESTDVSATDREVSTDGSGEAASSGSSLGKKLLELGVVVAVLLALKKFLGGSKSSGTPASDLGGLDEPASTTDDGGVEVTPVSASGSDDAKSAVDEEPTEIDVSSTGDEDEDEDEDEAEAESESEEEAAETDEDGAESEAEEAESDDS
jgi:hypothetical protein